MHKKIPVFITTICLTLLFVSAGIAAADDISLDLLALNGGENISLQISSNTEVPLKITTGRAERVPRKPRMPYDEGKTVVELDVRSASFAVKTDAKQLFISGAQNVTIKGVEANEWGAEDAPALFIDRDCNLRLEGVAGNVAVIYVNKFARVVIDASKLATRRVIVVGNDETKVIASSHTNVNFVEANANNQMVVSGYGDSGAAPAGDPAAAAAPAGDAPAAADGGE